MRNFINNLSLRSKIICIIVLVSGASSFASNVVFLFNEHIKSKNTAISEVMGVVRIVANNTVVALEFSDVDEVKNNLATLAQIDNILQAGIFVNGHKPIALLNPRAEGYVINPHLYHQLSQAQKNMAKQNGLLNEDTGPASEAYAITGNTLVVLKVIYLEGSVIGYIQLESKLQGFTSKLIDATKFGLLMILLSLVVAFIFASSLHRIITKPIKSILTTVEEVGHSSNYKLRIEKNRSDELGELIKGFNSMLAQIEHRDEVLADTNLILEQEVAQQTANLVYARDKALDASRAKTTFLANMSHEIRTPLNAILGFSQVLSSENLQPSHQDMVKRIEIAGESLLSVINDILDLSKIEAGQVKIKASVFEFSAMVEDLTALFSISCTNKGITWQVESQIQHRTWVAFDKEKLKQILINLIGNAVKFTKIGGVTLRISEISQADKNTNVDAEMLLRFEVIDTGRGIETHDMQRILEPFEQAEIDGFIEGTGLGLGIVQKLLGLFGSELKIKSELGVGSDFHFDIVVPLSLKGESTSTKTLGHGRALSVDKALKTHYPETVNFSHFQNALVARETLQKLCHFLALGQVSLAEELLTDIQTVDTLTLEFIRQCKLMLDKYDLEALIEQIEILVSSKGAQ